ncbi:MAG: T9SS type A sorting domain-containing protein, partial [Flavobacteriales bacterium]|nr:T9SS type A sorting domain-containing protein [Flavobacteriales bacterium]
SANCVCAGTAQAIDCNGVVNGTAAIDACGVCAGGNTGVVPNSSCLDCLGVPNGSALPGTSCNDNNANTINDVFSANCVCAGTAQPIDCNGVVNGTAAIDACGVCAGGNTGVVPNSSCLDCLGVPNGSALPGTACNDGNSSTMNDVYDTDCVCGGAAFLIDCTGTLNGSAMPGTHCDDGDPFTGNDTWSPGCFCVGQLLDCTGVPGGTAMPGAACDDQDPTTGNDTWNANCGCVGEPIDCSGDVGGSAWPGTPCDAQIPDNGADVWTLDCQCVGNGAIEDCNGVQGGQALPGTPCDDGNSGTGNDTWSLTCGCAGVPIDCAGVIGGDASIDACGQCAGGTTGVVPNADTDGDGLMDCDDSCPGIFNPEQNDYDGDGVGDGCDNCAWLANSDQTDANGNGIGDACEVMGLGSEPGVIDFSIWPNPTGGSVVITDGSNRIRMLRYHDLSGKQVMELPFAPRADLTDLATGTYIVIALDVEGRPLARTRLVKH